MLRNYIGLSISAHDPALAIVDSRGEVVFAEAAERYLQNKRAWKSVPDDQIRVGQLIDQYTESNADLVVAATWSRFYNRFYVKFLYNFLEPILRRFLPRDMLPVSRNIIIGQQASWLQFGNNVWLYNSLKNGKLNIEKRAYNHHLTHAAAACHGSPFEEAVCAVIDGYGERFSTAFYRYRDGRLRKIREIKPSLGSLGYFYSILCAACGFDPFKGEEWKVMGLASYGQYDEKLYRSLKPVFRVKKGRLHPAKYLQVFGKLLANKREPDKTPALESADLAYQGQLVFDECLTEILNYLFSLGISENLVLSGGCALNSVSNGTILKKTPFKRLYVFPAPGDDGNAVGAALCAYMSDHGRMEFRPEIQSPYLGSHVSRLALENVLKFGNLKSQILPGNKVIERAAALLADGKTVGWVQGRAEFGPRALGNRSILADPRRRDAKELLNSRIKFREEFRPFAPSILNEFGDTYFDDYQESPYMERALRFKRDMREKVPGVVHVDGTGRLQTVKREWNPKYYELIKAFHEITDIPIVLNTSFNVMGKPIIHSVEDALALFITTGLDVLVIEDCIFEK